MPHRKRFEGKVVFVTGAAAGIGRATAVRLASEGAALTIVDVAEEGLEETAKLCAEQGADVDHRLCDVSDETQVRASIDACIERHGRLDVLCNIAGILLLEHFEKIPIAKFRRLLEVNLVGTFALCQAAMPHLLFILLIQQFDRNVGQVWWCQALVFNRNSSF